MKYRAISADRASTLLDELRAGGEMDDDAAATRGEGKELSKSVLEGIQKQLAKIKSKFASVIGARDPEGGLFERQACIVVHEALADADPQMLADYDFWTWIALEFRELVEWRHGGKEGIAHPANFGIGKRDDNLFYRLWLRGEIGHSEEARYELAGRGDQDFWRSHIFRQDYGKCRTLVHAFLSLQFPTPGDKARWNTDHVRKLAKRLRRVNATLIFESLDDDGAKTLVEREAIAAGSGK